MWFIKLSTSAVLLLNLYLARSVDGRSCDGTMGTTPKSNPEIITGVPECPQNDGDIVMTSDGGYYSFQCCMHESKGAQFIESVQTTGYDDCIEKCGLAPGCQAFRYVYGDYADEKTGACRLYRSGTFSDTKCGNTLHDWAYLTDPPIVEVEEKVRAACSTECPDADGQVYTAKNKQMFQLDCQKRHGTAWFGKLDASSLKECTEACASYIGCQSVDFHARTNKCYLGKRTSKPTLEASGWATAYSLGCAGACSEDCCDKSCSSTPTSPPPQITLPSLKPVASVSPEPSTGPVIDPPAPAKEVNCPGDDNSEVSVEGEKYQIRCDKQYFQNGQIKLAASGVSYTECLKLCSGDSTCNSVDYHRPADTKACYTFNGGGEPSRTSTINWAAFKV